ncbi:MAG: alpha/beta hydrolase [Azonexus sp.]|nr:alpha/beta hydrolase [Azonexus sp.]
MIGATIFFTQAQYLYQNDVGQDIVTTPRDAGLSYEDVWLDAAPEVKLHGWFVPHPSARGTVLLFHGNASSIGNWLEWPRLFHHLGYAAFIIDYRGFGRSTGTPSEQGTHEDASAAWRYLTATRGITAKDIVIVGHLLGGAVAAELAARVTPRALVLQSTFTAFPDLAADIYPWLPTR